MSSDKPIALVVDDSRVVRGNLAKILTGAGFDVREASNGKEALMRFEQGGGTIGLLLVDLNMPEMDGMQLLETLRRDPANASVVILMVTTECDPEEIGRALKAGANEYVMKPFTPEIILGKLRMAGLHGPEEDDEQSRDAAPAGQPYAVT